MSDRALRNLMIAGLIGSIVTICLNIVKALQWVRPGRSLCATNARSALPRAYSSDPVVNNKLLIALWRMVTTGEFRTASCCGKRLSRLADDARKHKEFRRARREFLCLTGRSLSEVVVTRARTWSSNRSLEWARRLGASLRKGWRCERQHPGGHYRVLLNWSPMRFAHADIRFYTVARCVAYRSVDRASVQR
jgi:hypothetical protein